MGTREHTASVEDYLEAIMLAADEKKQTTVTGISRSMGVTKPSVTSALARLSELWLVTHPRYGQVCLTDKGFSLARDIYHRHQALKRFLVEILNVDHATAAEDACRLEHHLSKTSMDRLDKFMQYVMECPQGKPVWLDGLDYFMNHGKRNPQQLADCIDRCKAKARPQ